jgi:alkyl hydroperoxide reductase subunit AhpC
MSLQLGDIAPDFKAKTSLGDISLHAYLGDSWGVLFSHPADYTPVCTTELGRTAALHAEFEKRDVKALALSVDDVKVDFPIIADEDKSIAHAYGMIHPKASETFTVRSLFIIGPDKKIKLTLTYPASTGRNFVEVLRVIDSLQLAAEYSVATPADWKEGEDVIIGLTIKTEDAAEKFPKGVRIVKPYLRYTPQPNK